MILLYTLLLALLAAVEFLVSRRVRRLERKYTRASAEANKLLHEPLYRQGNSGRSDPYVAARRQYQLGQLAEVRDRLEARHFAWQSRANRLRRILAGVRSWKGRKLPYTFGVVDVSLLMYAFDRYGLNEYVSLEALQQLAGTLLAR
jgi:hypothetical protein